MVRSVPGSKAGDGHVGDAVRVLSDCVVYLLKVKSLRGTLPAIALIDVSLSVPACPDMRRIHDAWRNHPGLLHHGALGGTIANFRCNGNGTARPECQID